MRVKNHQTISSNCDFLGAAAASPNKMVIFPYCTTAIRGTPRFLVWNPRCSQAGCWRNKVCGWHTQVLCWMSPDLLATCRWFSSASRFTWRRLHWSSQLWDLTPQGFLSDNSQTLPESPVTKCIFLMTWIARDKLLNQWSTCRQCTRCIMFCRYSWHRNHKSPEAWSCMDPYSHKDTDSWGVSRSSKCGRESIQ